jgi:glutathione S-transferase
MVAAEAGTPLQIRQIDLNTKNIEGGGNLFDINPLGQVGTLVTPEGVVLSENAAIMNWLQTHGSNDAFRVDPTDPEYFTMISWLGFCGTELHKALIWQLVRADTSEAAKDMARSLAPVRLAHIDRTLEDRDHLLDRGVSAPDFYLLWCTSMLRIVGIDLSKYANIKRAMKVLRGRDSVAPILAEDSAASRAISAAGGTPNIVAGKKAGD